MTLRGFLVLLAAAVMLAGCASQKAGDAKAKSPVSAAAEAERPDVAEVVVKKEAAEAAAPAKPAKPAPAPAVGDVPDLPVYPGATRTSFEQKSGDEWWGREVEAEYEVKAPFADVRSYYEKAIAAGGWTIVGSKFKEDEARWTLRRDGTEAEVEVETEKKRMVTITLKRKDR